MSIVVALKYNSGVVLGADRQITSDGHLASTEVTKIYKSEFSNTAYGVVGYLRDIDLISCNIDDLMKAEDVLRKVDFDKRYVVNTVVDRLFNMLRHFNRVIKIDFVEEIQSSVLVASNDKIFSIGHDGSVCEYETFGAIGCGLELVQGYLNPQHLEDLSEPEAIDLVKRCVQEACKTDVYINDKVDIIVLKKKGK